ncbi:mechanosensitive ion channel family protein [Alcanivorax sp. JB21]|uniref:mechanosensitive ion channel family protein n=1 Tax=Alcanivorax limicola TaxID=2874102 RepID=UPI001CBBA597|nr:mechanosensitive ion channel family protein [Alcanivorax limicola]MBZ2188049.1 mechanosensitive ion channel family protein [Alcanivorax limicola]
MNGEIINGDLFEQLLATSAEPRIWMLQVFVVVLVTVTLNFILMRLIDLIERLVKNTETLWDDALLEAARLPVRLVIWVVGLSFAINIMQEVAPAAVFESLPEIRRLSLIVILALFLTRFIRNAEQVLVDGSKVDKPMDQTTAKAVGKLLRLSVVITAGLLLLQNMGYSISGVLAFGGIGGIAIGFAAKDLLANFFGGMMVYLDKPFRVGDWVRSPDRDIEGTVEDIGWRLTRIRTFDKRPLYIPNAMFSSIVVENPSRMHNRRIFETLGVRYQDGPKLQVICDEVMRMLQAHEEIESDHTLMVNFNSYGASSLEFFIYAFTRTTNWVKFHQVKQDVLLKVMAIVESYGAEFAFPTRTLHFQPATPAEASSRSVTSTPPAAQAAPAQTGESPE